MRQQQWRSLAGETVSSKIAWNPQLSVFPFPGPVRKFFQSALEKQEMFALLKQEKFVYLVGKDEQQKGENLQVRFCPKVLWNP